MGVLDKVRKFKNQRPKNEGRSKTKGIFHEWQDGPNDIRLVGEFLEAKTHFLASAKQRGERGMCMDDAFEKDNEHRIMKVVNCPDWDINTEQAKGELTCPVCKLYRIASQALKEDPSPKEKQYFETLKQSARLRTNLKWNIFDRLNPDVTVIDENGNESKQKGLKIATIGMEAWGDIEGIFEQCGFDITDPEEGVDIRVTKGNNGTRVSYSAQVILEGKGLKVTPFDEEERSIVDAVHDLKVICGRETKAEDIRAGLHGDYRELLELNEEEEEESETSSSATCDDPDIEEEDEDEDALLGGTQKKK